jgi:hypothetical protein
MIIFLDKDDLRRGTSRLNPSDVGYVEYRITDFVVPLEVSHRASVIYFFDGEIYKTIKDRYGRVGIVTEDEIKFQLFPVKNPKLGIKPKINSRYALLKKGVPNGA